MNIHVDKDSEVPLHEQVSAQLVFLIGTGRLKPGTFLPSVRALAQRLRVHRNTISRAYHDLTLNKLVEKRAGRRLTIRLVEPDGFQSAGDLDELIRVAISEAQRRGYSLQQIHDRLRAHTVAAPPDRLLVLSDDAGMRMLLTTELKERFEYSVDACTPDELLSKPERSIGAVVVSPQGHIARIRSVLSRRRPAIPIRYSSADEHLEAIRRIKNPSLIAVVSVSPYFLEMARGVLAAAVGSRHAMRGYLMAGSRPSRPGAADFVVCDCLTFPILRPQYKAQNMAVYRLISAACIDTIASAMGDSGVVRTTT